MSDKRIIRRRYASRFRFTWASTRWLFSAIWALVLAENRKNSARPIRIMPTTATAVKASDKMPWMLLRR